MENQSRLIFFLTCNMYMYILVFFHQRNYFLVKILNFMKKNYIVLYIINKKQTKVKINFMLKLLLLF